jgi:hypothetical protein
MGGQMDFSAGASPERSATKQSLFEFVTLNHRSQGSGFSVQGLAFRV